MKFTLFAVSITMILCIHFPLHAHHSIVSQYDPEVITTIEGVVTEVWFKNPHSRVYVEVTGENGEKELWETETYPRSILLRRGWKANDLKKGDVVLVQGRRARNGAPRLQILSITRPSDGWEGVGYSPDSVD